MKFIYTQQKQQQKLYAKLCVCVCVCIDRRKLPMDLFIATVKRNSLYITMFVLLMLITINLIYTLFLFVKIPFEKSGTSNLIEGMRIYKQMFETIAKIKL